MGHIDCIYALIKFNDDVILTMKVILELEHNHKTLKGRVWSKDLLEQVGPTVELTTLGNKLHRPVGGAIYYFVFVYLIFKVL